MIRTLGFLLLALGSLPAQAALLLEVNYASPPVTAPASFGFGIGGHVGFINWVETIPAFPSTTHSNATLLAEFDRVLTSGYSAHQNDIGFGIRSGVFEPARLNPSEVFYLDRAIYEGFYATRGVTAVRHAPLVRDVIYGLPWYDLTDIERTVTTTSHTLRIYGEASELPPVPEPASAILLVIAIACHFSRWRPC